MKKVTTILAAILLMAVGAAAQKLSYQAVVRNSSNELVPNTALTVEVSILDAVGAVQYAETHSATTNQNGLLVLTIGDGTVTAGTTVADVDWNGAAIQSVVKNGSTVVATITSPVNAVPYALQAGNVSAMSVADLLALVGSMTDAEKEQLRDALGVTGGGSSDPTTFVCGTSKMVDADGNEYETVQIGTQCWTKTNLRVAPAGATDASSSGASSNTEPYYYVNSAFNPAVYGYYYNWEAAKLACPTGWHLPSDAEWTTMEQTQTSMDVTGSGWRGDHAGKLAGEGWNPSTTAGAPGNASDPDHNASGFSAVPAGYCYGSSFGLAGNYAVFWSATQNSSNGAYGRGLYSNSAGVTRYDSDKDYGRSVRCVRDAEPGGEEPTSFNCGTSKMVDADGNEYETVQIGTQCWTKTNLRVAPAGATDASSSGASSNTEPYYYVNSAFNPAVYGYYYNWEAAKLACPTGWHLPSDAEWTTLTYYVSSQSEFQCGGNSSYIARALASTEGWKPSSSLCVVGNDPSTNNDLGFGAVPAGGWDDGFYYAGDDAYFWSSSEYGTDFAWSRSLYFDAADVTGGYGYRYDGFSVRCLRD